MSTTQPVQPIQQPPIEDLRNALQIAQFWGMGMAGYAEVDTQKACTDIARLLTHAIEALGEPNLASVQAAEIMLREWEGSYDTQRNHRDVAAVILRAAVTGEPPKTWEVS